MQVAQRWKRLVARVVDVGVLAVLAVGALFAAHRTGIDYVPVSDLIVLLVLVGYEALVPAATKGNSLGRYLTATRLAVEGSGQPPGVLRCLARAASRLALFAVFSVFVAYGVELSGLLAVLLLEGFVGALQRSRQTIADLVARTVVIESPVGIAAAAIEQRLKSQ